MDGATFKAHGTQDVVLLFNLRPKPDSYSLTPRVTEPTWAPISVLSFLQKYEAVVCRVFFLCFCNSFSLHDKHLQI